MQKVVGLLGLRGAGKDTAASALVSAGWRRVGFADPLYREVAEAFGVTVEFLGNRATKETPQAELALERCTDEIFVGVVLGLQPDVPFMEGISKPRSPREIMQFWGTEYRRVYVRDDYWIEQTRQVLTANPDLNYVITDVRFPNEATMVKAEFDGVLARVVRPSLQLNDPSLQHPSETVMLNYPVDYTFVNEDGPAGLVNLKSAVKQQLLELEPSA